MSSMERKVKRVKPTPEMLNDMLGGLKFILDSVTDEQKDEIRKRLTIVPEGRLRMVRRLLNAPPFEKENAKE